MALGKQAGIPGAAWVIHPSWVLADHTQTQRYKDTAVVYLYSGYKLQGTLLFQINATETAQNQEIPASLSALCRQAQL